MRKMESYANYLGGLEHRGVLGAEIHLITGIDRKARGDWDRFTTKGCTVYEGFGRHIEMVNPGFLEKNAEIIRKIIEV